MKTPWIALFGLIFSNTLASADSSIANLNSSGVILDGYDAVSYFESPSPLKGDAKIQATDEGVTYYFANETNKSKFVKNPKKFAPQFGGWCAYAVADSKSKVDIDPKSYLIQDGRLLVFYKGLWGNTREKWQTNKSKDAKEYLKQADQNWPEVKGTKP